MLLKEIYYKQNLVFMIKPILMYKNNTKTDTPRKTPVFMLFYKMFN